ncbi:hypothetical protein Tco_0764744 [Tanacetum coccineum]
MTPSTTTKRWVTREEIVLSTLVYDTGYGTHICNTTQGLRGERKLKQGDVYLYVGNGMRAQVEAIRSLDLVLPNSLVICLDNCHYAPTITRGVVSVSRLVDNGFIQRLRIMVFQFLRMMLFIFNTIPLDDIYEIDMLNLVSNVNSIYNVNNKRAKHNLDFTYPWHYHFAHISKKRIEKLQHDGLLNPTDSESFNLYISYLSRKMTRKPFLHQTERATDLLGLIHTDICGPLKHVWGCEALVKRNMLDKLQQRSIKCIFVGYSKETMGYYFYFQKYTHCLNLGGFTLLLV